MGLMSAIANVLGGMSHSLDGNDEQRDWLSDDDWMFGATSTYSGARVDRRSSLQVATVNRCVRLLTDSIATAPTDLIVSVGGRRFVEYNKPRWMSMPDPGDPAMSALEHFAQVTTSLLLDGSFFVLVPNGIMPDGGAIDPVVLIVLDPRRVEVRKGPMYDIYNDVGQITMTVGADKMLQGSWMRMPGALRSFSPIEMARQSIGLGLTTEEFAARFFGQGTTVPFGVEVPGSLTAQQKEDFYESIRRSHAGTSNAHRVMLLQGGGRFATNLGVNNNEAQFLESRKFTVEEIGRIYGIPPHMLGSQEPGASSYNSVEIRSQEYKQYAVLPLARRIEDVYQRVVTVPAAMSSAQASASFRFNLDGIARADIKTRAETAEIYVRSGIKTPNEAREKEDLPPRENGDALYMQQQMVPIGTVPDKSAPSEPDDDDRSVTFNLNADQVRMDPPTMPDIPAPVVNVTTPEVIVPPIEVPPAVVNYTPPELRVPAPIVDMTPVAEAIDRLSRVMKPRKRTVVRDQNGRIVGIEEK